MLTICLWTKGRERYIEEILNSISNSLKNDQVRYFIFDNGTEPHIHSILKRWHESNSVNGIFVRIESNDPRPATLWRELRKKGIDWVVFPSDDDIFCSEIVVDWMEAIERNPNLVGFASSATTIDENSNQLDRILHPTLIGLNSEIEKVAASFHEPPFVWPCLFLRMSKLPQKLPSSRFAFDWYVSLQLLIAGEVLSTSKVGLKYRVHSKQESFQAPLRRKFMEAEICHRKFVDSREFRNWIGQQSDEERLNFYRILLGNPPIYGDPIFSISILAQTLSTLIEFSSSFESKSLLISEYARFRGVLLKDGESTHLIDANSEEKSATLGNVRILPSAQSCSNLASAADFLTGNRVAKTFEIHCNHSRGYSKKSIKIDCTKFDSTAPSLNADLMILTITNFLENQGDLNFTLTPGERKLLRIIRKYRNYLPSKWIKLWKSGK